MARLPRPRCARGWLVAHGYEPPPPRGAALGVLEAQSWRREEHVAHRRRPADTAVLLLVVVVVIVVVVVVRFAFRSTMAGPGAAALDPRLRCLASCLANAASCAARVATRAEHWKQNSLRRVSSSGVNIGADSLLMHWMTPTTTPACDLIGRQRIERVRYPVAASILRLNRASLYASAMFKPSPVVATAPMMRPVHPHADLGLAVADAAPQLLLTLIDEEERGAVGLHHFAHAAEHRLDHLHGRERHHLRDVVDPRVGQGLLVARLPLLDAHLVDDRRELLAEVAQRRLVLVREDGRLAGDAAPELVDALHDADRLAAEHHLAAGRLHRADRHHEHRPRLVAGLPVDVRVERRVVGGALEVDDVPARHRLAGDRVAIGGDRDLRRVLGEDGGEPLPALGEEEDRRAVAVQQPLGPRDELGQ